MIGMCQGEGRMAMTEKEAIECALESEKGTMTRQQLLKQLWELNRREQRPKTPLPELPMEGPPTGQASVGTSAV